MAIFAFIGSFINYVIALAGGLSIMFFQAFRALFKGSFRTNLFIKQLEFIGVNSIPVVVLTGLFTGMVFAFQAYFGFHKFGMEQMTGMIVALAMARELGPVLSAIMVTARAGSAITAELGTMRVTEQIDAIEALAVDPIQYLVVPRVLAGFVVMPLLNAITVFSGIIGGYLLGVKGLGINETLYMDNMIRYFEPSDFNSGMLKALVFGTLLTLVGCYKGFNTSGGAFGVGKSTTDSVVISCVLILVFDYILTAMLF